MKLIILNGSPASGKSTLAEKLHADLPLSLLVNVDDWRKLINSWRENKEESSKLVYELVLAAADTYLKMKHDVIIDKAILDDTGVLNALTELGTKHGANVYEFILMADKETTLRRATERGFHENGLLTLERVGELWDMAQELKVGRSSAVLIDTGELDVEAAYQKVKSLVIK